MAAEILREYLIKLGYKVEAGQQRSMADAIAAMTVKVTELAAAVEGAATAVVAGVARIAQQFENLYYASRRTHDGVENINAFSYAISQMGGSVEGARSSLESLARFLRSSPGAAGVLKSIGVDVTDATGKLRGMSSIMLDLAKRFREMPYYRASAYASFLGIDERTLQAMINGTKQFSDEYREMARRVGLDSDQAAEHSTFFMRRLRALEQAISLIFQKVATDMAGGLGADMEKLRNLILDNSDSITQAITFVARTILFAGALFVRFLTSAVDGFKHLRDWWENLDPQFRKAVFTIGLIAFAFRALNSAIRAGPIGMLWRIATLLTLVYDDYKAWKEGGQHFINWDYWGPEIQKAYDGVKQVATAIDDIVEKTGGWQHVAELFLAFYTGKFILGIVTTTASAIAQMTAATTAATTSVATVAGGAVSALAGIAARMAPISAFIYEMWPKATAGKDMDETGYGKRTPSMAGPRSPDPQEFSWLDPSTWKWSGFGTPKQAIEFFQSKGYSLSQAAGLAANIKAESNYNPNIYGDKGEAYGIGQWHPDRQKLFEQVMHRPIQGSSFQEQLEFMDWELKHKETGAYNALQAARNDPTAAARAGVLYERPADMTDAALRRGAEAQRLASMYAGSNPGANVQVNQTNNVNVTGVADPNAAAAAVSSEHRRNNADLQRNLQGAVR